MGKTLDTIVRTLNSTVNYVDRLAPRMRDFVDSWILPSTVLVSTSLAAIEARERIAELFPNPEQLTSLPEKIGYKLLEFGTSNLTAAAIAALVTIPATVIAYDYGRRHTTNNTSKL